MNLSVLQGESELTTVVLKEIEDAAIAEGLDVIGLSEKPINEELIDFLHTLDTFLLSPVKENMQSYAEHSDDFFDRNL